MHRIVVQQIAVDDRYEGQGAGVAHRHLVEHLLGGRQQRGHIDLGDSMGFGGGDAQVLKNLVGHPLGAALLVHRGGGRTLGDRIGEQPLGRRDGQHGRHDPGAGGFTEEGDS